LPIEKSASKKIAIPDDVNFHCSKTASWRILSMKKSKQGRAVSAKAQETSESIYLSFPLNQPVQHPKKTLFIFSLFLRKFVGAQFLVQPRWLYGYRGVWVLPPHDQDH
jgi:hypothetical protein